MHVLIILVHTNILLHLSRSGVLVQHYMYYISFYEEWAEPDKQIELQHIYLWYVITSDHKILVSILFNDKSFFILA